MATKRKTSSRRRASTSKRGSGRRQMLKGPKATFFAKRRASGRFKEMDERGRSLAGDRRRKAMTKAKSGYGDRGDRRVA
jgi:hypothetical protein